MNRIFFKQTNKSNPLTKNNSLTKSNPLTKNKSKKKSKNTYINKNNPLNKNINVKIVGASNDQSLHIKLIGDESKIVSDSGKMNSIYGYEDLCKQVTTNMNKKSIMGSLWSSVSGVGLFLNTFNGRKDKKPLNIILSNEFPGEIIKLTLTRNNPTILISSNAFLACNTNIELTSDVKAKALFSTSSFIVTTASLKTSDNEGNSGNIWASSFGNIRSKYLKKDEKMTLDDGLLVATNIQDYDVKLFCGLKSSILGGEGFIVEFIGPGIVWYSSKSMSAFINTIAHHIPRK